MPRPADRAIFDPIPNLRSTGRLDNRRKRRLESGGLVGDLLLLDSFAPKLVNGRRQECREAAPHSLCDPSQSDQLSQCVVPLELGGAFTLRSLDTSLAKSQFGISPGVLADRCGMPRGQRERVGNEFFLVPVSIERCLELLDLSTKAPIVSRRRRRIPVRVHHTIVDPGIRHRNPGFGQSQRDVPPSCPPPGRRS
jgi:hypothetical protein